MAIERRGRAVVAGGALWVLTLLAGATPPESVALKNVRIIPVVGEEILKGTLLIERGKIKALGADVEVPFDARVYDLSGKVVMPGMVIAGTASGLDVPNEPRPVTPQLDVYDAVDPAALFFEECLRLGHTAVHVIQGDNTVIGGVGRAVRPIGLSPDEMTLAEPSFLKISVSPRAGFDRMQQLATLRESLLGLEDYIEKLCEKRYEDQRKEAEKPVDVLPAEARKRGLPLLRAEDLDDEHRNLLRLRGGQPKLGDQAGPKLLEPLGAFIACREATDVGAAVSVASEFGFIDRSVLTLGGDCYKAVSELKAAARPVVLPPDLTYRETDPLTGKVSETFVPSKIAEAGLLYALLPSTDASLPERMLTYQAARCVRAGISRDDALRAITLNPAKILGLDGRLGSLEPGKDAHLVVYSGDPLDFNSVVEKVFIEGILAYEREKDVRLQRLLTSQPAARGDSQ